MHLRAMKQHIRTLPVRLRRRSADAGQALVETALVLPIVLLLLFALVDFGRAFYTWLVITNAAREGARAGAVQASDSTIRSRINDTASNLDSGALAITLTNVQGDRGETIEVDLVYDFEWATPLGSFMAMFGGNLDDISISSHASMRLE